MAEQNVTPDQQGWLTLPNLVTGLRVILVVPIVWFLIRGDHPALTLALLVIFGTSDWVDGFLARRLRRMPEVSVLGKIRTALLMTGLALLGLGLLPGYGGFAIAGQWAAMLGAILHGLAGIGYVGAALTNSGARALTRRGGDG